MEQLITENYLIYKVADTNLYAAVAYPHLRDIRQYATEYQGLSQVPADKSVKGIVFEAAYHGTGTFDEGREVELPINQLQFDTGNLRLSA